MSTQAEINAEKERLLEESRRARKARQQQSGGGSGGNQPSSVPTSTPTPNQPASPSTTSTSTSGGTTTIPVTPSSIPKPAVPSQQQQQQREQELLQRQQEQARLEELRRQQLQREREAQEEERARQTELLRLEQERLAQERAQAEDERQREVIEEARRYLSNSVARFEIDGRSIYSKDYDPLYRAALQSGQTSQWWMTDVALDYALERERRLASGGSPTDTVTIVSSSVSFMAGAPDAPMDIPLGVSDRAITIVIPIMAQNKTSSIEGHHWTLLVVQNGQANYFDSLNKGLAANTGQTAERIVQRLRDADLVPESAKIQVRDIQTQKGWECGYIVTRIVRAILRGELSLRGGEFANGISQLNENITEEACRALAFELAYGIATEGKRGRAPINVLNSLYQDIEDEDLRARLYDAEQMNSELRLLIRQAFEERDASQPVRTGAADCNVVQRALDVEKKANKPLRDRIDELERQTAASKQQHQREIENLTRTMGARLKECAEMGNRYARMVEELSDLLRQNQPDIDLSKYRVVQLSSGVAQSQTMDLGDTATLKALKNQLTGRQTGAVDTHLTMTLRIDEGTNGSMQITVPNVRMTRTDGASVPQDYAVAFDKVTRRTTVNNSQLRNDTIVGSGTLSVELHDSLGETVRESVFSYDVAAQSDQLGYVLSNGPLRLYINSLGEGTFKLKMVTLSAE